MSRPSEFSNEDNQIFHQKNQNNLNQEKIDAENSYDLPRQSSNTNKKINSQKSDENTVKELEPLVEEIESRPKQIKNAFNHNEEVEINKNKKRRNKNKNSKEKIEQEINSDQIIPNIQSSSCDSNKINENICSDSQILSKSERHFEGVLQNKNKNSVIKEKYNQNNTSELKTEEENSNFDDSIKHEFSIRGMKRENKILSDGNTINKIHDKNSQQYIPQISSTSTIPINSEKSKYIEISEENNNSNSSDPYNYLKSEASEVKNLLSATTEKKIHTDHSHKDHSSCHHSHSTNNQNDNHEHPHHNSSTASAIEISINTKKCSHSHEHHDHDHHHHDESYIDSNKKYQHGQEKFKISFDFIINSSLKLIKTNEEFFYLIILLGIWLSLILFEFVYGFLETHVHIISDSFFNYFKTFSFLIAGLAILLTRVSVIKESFLKNRIELIAALSNCVFLIIVSMYMVLQALHMVTEPGENHEDSSAHSHHPINQQELDTISFFKNFFIFKVIIDVVGVLVFSDYIVHPSVQIKLLIWKKHRLWKQLKDLSLENLKECKLVIKQWNNHFENMNALTVNILSDLLSSILFLICFYFSKDRHFEGVYCFISIVNLVFLFFLLAPLLKSLIKIFMQGRSELYECFYAKLHQEVSYFEGCLGIKDIKFWMTAQNDIKCKIKIITFPVLNFITYFYLNIFLGLMRIYSNSDLKPQKLKEHIHRIVDDLEISFDMTLQINN